jgi:hypothetical protein
MEKLAIISVRLPLEFNPRALRSQDTERTLVEKHIHVCIGVDSAVESAVTIVPSEPILAEASYLVMKTDKFDLPHFLLAQFADAGLDKGTRGEFIVMTICLQARDAAAAQLGKSVIPVKTSSSS